jgi:hypothetical protein
MSSVKEVSKQRFAVAAGATKEKSVAKVKDVRCGGCCLDVGGRKGL